MPQFNEATHTYTVDGLEYPSVTTIIKAEGMIDTAFFTEQGRERGTLVHKIVHYYLMGCLDPESVDPALQGYFDAYLKFEKESGFEWEETEKQCVNLDYGFAGTIDLIGRLNDCRVIIDIKTGANDPATGIQLAAYEILCGFPVKRYALQLSEDGTYKLHPFTDRADRSIFLAALAVYRWKHNTRRR